MKTLTAIILSLIMFQGASALEYEYDAAGRLTKVMYDNGTETRFTYDLNGNMIQKVTDVTSSVSETVIDETVRLYPQPAADRITIEIENVGSERVELSVYDINGALVLKADRYIQNGTCSLDVRHLSNGVYQIRISGGSTKASRSITIMR